VDRHLQAQRPARIVNVASKVHELGRLRVSSTGEAVGTGGPLPHGRVWAAQAYADSKLAQVRTMNPAFGFLKTHFLT